jgi:hypothetical protein
MNGLRLTYMPAIVLGTQRQQHVALPCLHEYAAQSLHGVVFLSSRGGRKPVTGAERGLEVKSGTAMLNGQTQAGVTYAGCSRRMCAVRACIISKSRIGLKYVFSISTTQSAAIS